MKGVYHTDSGKTAVIDTISQKRYRQKAVFYYDYVDLDGSVTGYTGQTYARVFIGTSVFIYFARYDHKTHKWSYHLKSPTSDFHVSVNRFWNKWKLFEIAIQHAMEFRTNNLITSQ